MTQETIGKTICVPGWTAGVRPVSSFTDSVKINLLREAGLSAGATSFFVLDHFVPLALGGHPTKLENLWIQGRYGRRDAHAKDHLEAKLRRLVCTGKISLKEAQDAILSGWEKAMPRYVTDADLAADPEPVE